MMIGAESKIAVEYTCKPCKTHRRKVVVRARYGEEEPITLYMQSVQKAVGEDHKCQAPFCRGSHYDLFIPMRKDAYIGQAGGQ